MFRNLHILSRQKTATCNVVVAYKCCTLHLKIYFKRQFTVGLSRQQPMSIWYGSLCTNDWVWWKEQQYWTAGGPLLSQGIIVWKGSCNHSDVIMTVIGHQCRKEWRSTRCLPTYIHTHTHTHTYINTYILQTYIHKFIYIHTCVLISVHTYIYTHICIHTYI
jgi:hypothetical protein